ncbi:tetratricopeptide repeat protein [Adhaeribacter radiodurans]|uniref:Tetratricopeptide repeat protein n=1 Tax=Adhaeribacter radiodurans TaxID=2745197 RepID=A0A7L7LCX5_9BACT|nr:hypothetical protein [Adhaeribacter radiodurans]QMU30544.1 hypothetical protein HUW48_22075 [Adhaeribacter radiodurans]
MANAQFTGWLIRLGSSRLSRIGLVVMLIFNLAYNSSAQTLLPKSSYKYKVMRQVFDRLTYAFANGRPQPGLEVIAQNRNKQAIIAMYRPGNQPVIQFDEEVYDLCVKLQKDSLNAIAVLLSHELAHHYEKHDWYFTFGISQPNTDTSKESIKQFESAADFYGCFYGELSGYATGRVFPQVLDMLYKQFDLSENLNGYPTKEERKAIYAEKQKEAIQMVAVFKAGFFLYLVQEFESSAQCFNYLVNKFPSREIYNNLAAAKLQQALVLSTGRDILKFAYPVELDAQSRLVTRNRAVALPFNEQQYLQLLADARKYSEQAREVDPKYVPAYINLACIYSLQGNQPAAVGIINELSPELITGDAHTVRAIAYFKDNQFSKSQKDFELAQQKGAHMAQYNLELANKMNESLTGSMASWIMSWFDELNKEESSDNPVPVFQEQIGGKKSNVALPTSAPQIKISRNPNLSVQWNELNDHWQLGIQNSTRNYLVRLTHENYLQPSAGKVKRGMHYTTLAKNYGKPSYTFSGASGKYWVYTNNKIAFNMDKNGRVNSWFIYSRTL